MTESNLDIWNKLGRTNPAHTKGFKRGGGFTGTAVKPIYTEQKMTETFGPVGIGWGFSEPHFQLVPGENKEVLVYCWLTLWYVQDGKRSGDIPGVGGDKVITHIKANEQYNRPERWENDDEAFKKAFTDAIGNAMKHLGMSADVHMGRFDDSKYVNDMKREMAEQEAAKPASKAESREVYDRLSRANRALATEAEFNKFWAQASVQDAARSLPADWKQSLKSEKDDKAAELAERAALSNEHNQTEDA